MAQINLEKLKRLEKERNTIHSKVVATYSVFEANGEKYLQIDTYGNDNREMPEKISQSFQLDRTTGMFLARLIIEEFNLL
jgi:hypothetical protein